VSALEAVVVSVDEGCPVGKSGTVLACSIGSSSRSLRGRRHAVDEGKGENKVSAMLHIARIHVLGTDGAPMGRAEPFEHRRGRGRRVERHRVERRRSWLRSPWAWWVARGRRSHATAR